MLMCRSVLCGALLVVVASAAVAAVPGYITYQGALTSSAGNPADGALAMSFAIYSRARGGTPGPKAASTLDIGGPDMDFVALAEGMGVKASRATTAEEFNARLEEALQASGPRLIDAVVPTLY